VYFRTLNVHAVSEEGLPGLIRDHLVEVKHRYDDPTLPTRSQGSNMRDMGLPHLTTRRSASDANG
jgi:hypothetical protein